MCGTYWKKLCQCNSFEEFSEKQRRVELKSVGNFVAKAVLVESANQFSLEVLCRTQYSLKYYFPYEGPGVVENVSPVSPV